MDRQAYRLTRQWTDALFQERMPVTSAATPPGAGQRSQERERFEPYGESSSLGASARTQASGYGQHFHPPTNSWGQSQPAWVNFGPTRPSEVAYGPLHALAVSLGQSSPMHSAVQQGGPVHTLAVHTHPGPSNAPAASSQQYGQSNPTVSPLQAPLFPLDSHLHYGSAILTAAQTHPGQTHGPYLVPPVSITTAEPPRSSGPATKQQNEGQQGIEFWDMHDLINKVDRYAILLREEMQRKTASKGTCYRNPVVSYAEADGPPEAKSDEVDMSLAKVSMDKPFICRGLVKADNSRTKILDAKFVTRETKAYTFDLTKAEAIFDLLLSEKKVKLSFGHKIPKPEELKGKTFCKYHSSCPWRFIHLTVQLRCSARRHPKIDKR
ncbi:unnamed protein product [Prunus brigantina]